MKENEIESELPLFKEVLESHCEGVVITDSNGKIQWINDAFYEITGYSLLEVLDKNPKILKSGIHDQQFYNNMWSQLKSEGKWGGEIWNKNKKGNVYSEWLNIYKLHSKGSTWYAGIFRDLSEKKKADKKINYLQQNDLLTGLYNREHFIDLINKSIKNKRLNQFSIILIDIDNFKEINNSLGHHIGDQLLIELSKRLFKLIKEEHPIARFSGDEFTILYSASIEKKKILDFCKKIEHCITKPFFIDNIIVHVNVNIGISRFPYDGKDIELLIRHSYIAMHKAKDKLQDRVCFYHSEMSKETEEKFLLSNHLVEAINNDEFSIYYQPIFNIEENGDVVGAEALLRWTNPTLGNVSPANFIPLAEKTGQILVIGEWVLRQVCKQINSWNEKGYKTIPISVNISVKQLEQAGFSDMIIRVLEISGVGFDAIELEITESVSSGELITIVDNLKELKNRGIKISMDDFGTGFSSLGQLDMFELDKLKIDKVFIDDIVELATTQGLVKSIIAMADSLGLCVVAEGVETQEQLFYLKEIGCKLGQGYLFSKPLPAKEVEVFLKLEKDDN